ncbi:hypothetical protein ANCDUO_14201 [Ancylostoma duodenale]|uniref:Uncharacterized protein n=1 Tax=Ancylostoma duodenale TaxID=51022 RepID=A0A0C2CGX8_9BILA|nr:hypothetical protein ANCDUO_14201 [Ancylostoma duodenale]
MSSWRHSRSYLRGQNTILKPVRNNFLLYSLMQVS